MKTPILCFALSLALTTSQLFGIGEPTALDAIKVLPKGAAKSLARIEAHEGTPNPERWYVIVYDKSTENGLREYVVTGGEIVASRTVSQFAESLSPNDVIGNEIVKVDSDKAAKLAQQYALANNVPIATLSYQLRKEGADAVPLWRITCMDEQGKQVGVLVLTASKGNIVSHEGFAVDPAPAVAEPLKPETNNTVASTGEPLPDDHPKVEPVKKKADDGADEKKPGFFRRAGGSMQKFFTGKNTISK